MGNLRNLSGVFARILFCLSLPILVTPLATAQTKVKLRNGWGQDVEVKLYSESEQKWVKPAIRVAKGKTAEWLIPYDGDHNVKVIADGKEFLLGTFDFAKVIQDKKVDLIELSQPKGPKAIPVAEVDMKSLKEGDIILTDQGKMKVEVTKIVKTETRMRAETRTRMVSITLGTGEVKQVPQTYTVSVPYTIAVETTAPKLVPVKSGNVTRGASHRLVFQSKGKPVQVEDSLKKK